MIVDVKVDPGRENDEGYYSRPIHMAIKKRNIVIVRILIENWVDLEVQDEDYNTPLELADELGFDEIAEYLLQHGAETYSSDTEESDSTSDEDCVEKPQRSRSPHRRNSF